MNEIKEIDLHRSGGANAPETVWSDDSALATRRDNCPNLNMKTPIILLLAMAAIVVPGHAAPVLQIATVISEKQADGAFHVVSRPSITVESGESASIGKTGPGHFRLSIKPTLLGNGSVLIESVLEIDRPAIRPEMTVAMGKQASIRTDDLRLTVTASLATK